MPNSLADSNNVSWGPDQLNALTAAVASAAMGASGETLNGLANFIKTMFAFVSLFGANFF